MFDTRIRTILMTFVILSGFRAGQNVARADVLSNNLSNATGGTEDATTTRYLAGTFTTNATTFYLTSVTLLLANPTAGTAALDLYSDGTLEPSALIATLTS